MSEGRSAHEPRQPPVVAGGAPPAGGRSDAVGKAGASASTGAASWAALAAEPDLEVPLPVPAGQAALAMRFRRIPAGEFVMGSRGNNSNEEPAHRVILPHDFWLGKFVVTQEEWQALVEACGPAGLEASPSRFKGERRPVERIFREGRHRALLPSSGMPERPPREPGLLPQGRAPERAPGLAPGLVPSGRH
jgi:hypothetical protein